MLKRDVRLGLEPNQWGQEMKIIYVSTSEPSEVITQHHNNGQLSKPGKHPILTEYGGHEKEAQQHVVFF